MPKTKADPNFVIKEFVGPIVWEYNRQKKTAHYLQSHNEGGKSKQQTLQFSSNEDAPSNEFAQNLCKAFVVSNIPLSKAEHPAIVEFLEKYTKEQILSRRTLTRVMEVTSKDLLVKLKLQLIGKPLFVIVDETTDCTGRAKCTILVGPLDGSFLGKPFHIDLADFNKTVQQCITLPLFKVLGNDLNYEEVRLLLPDGAAYCLKAGSGQKALFPNLIHATCLAYGLNKVAEKVRWCEVFAALQPAKSPSHQNQCSPARTWLAAAFYYADHYRIVKKHKLGMQPESRAIETAQELFQDNDIPDQFALIKANFQDSI
ncbi:hypothetical protein TCAL_17064 [Tigriopus californicus]|uniref:DUF659 domain-containing protein n=1 Tax=Tigriopus californicus TaxID=6832 RepID=A0A553PNL1_TIGCA|nr:hypothetical protein TCAL_17064 [Tigriopus californicus]